jgi:MFS family permease
MSPTGACTPVARPPASMLSDRDFRRYLGATVVSAGGSALTGVVLPLVVLRETQSAFLTSLVVVVQVMPYLLFGLVAGALADRANRRRMMYLCEACSGAASLGFVVVVAAGGSVAATALVVAAAVQVAAVFFGAAGFAAVPALVGRDRVVEAQSLVSSTTILVGLLAPAAGAALFGIVGAAPLFVADGASFLVSAALLAGITTEFHTPAEAGAADAGAAQGALRRLRAEIGDGLRYLWAETLVRALTLIGVLNALAGGIVTAGLVVFASRSFAVPPDDPRISAFFLAGSIGSLLGSFVLPALRRRWAALNVTYALLAASAAGALLLAAAPGLAVAVAACGLWNATYGMTITNGITLRMQILPDRYQSRVGSTARLLALSGAPIGALAAGTLAEHLDIRIVMGTAVVPVVAGFALAASFRRSLAERLPETPLPSEKETP